MIKAIHPYKRNGLWMFDDPDKGLEGELFVSGADHIMEAMAAGREKFTLIFSDCDFPSSHTRMGWVARADGGDWYEWMGHGMKGWLCPALLKYFPEAPKQLYVEVR